METDLAKHSGSKYIRRIWATGIKAGPDQVGFVDVDFYDIVNGLGISNPAIQHCLKKLMYTGNRRKGSRLQDLTEARDALSRDIDMEAALEARNAPIIEKLVSDALAGSPINDPKWEVVPAARPNQPVEGYLVRWSQPDEQGRYWWVGHYYAGPDASLAWCQIAAEGHARRWNDNGKRPEELKGNMPS